MTVMCRYNYYGDDEMEYYDYYGTYTNDYPGYEDYYTVGSSRGLAGSYLWYWVLGACSAAACAAPLHLSVAFLVMIRGVC
jgi:hypothetical protein